MARGPGERESRKLQLTGGATFTVSLPKHWIVANGLQPRDAVQVDWRPSGALRITPQEGPQESRRIVLSSERIPMTAMFDHLMGAYLSGADIIDIRFKPEQSRALRRLIREFLRSTRGFEIETEDENHISLVSLMNATELPMRASLNRMFLLLNSLIRDLIDAIDTDDLSLIEDLDEREREIDSLHFLIQRQSGIVLESYRVAESLGLTRRSAVEHANLGRTLERMADHAHLLALRVLENDSTYRFDLESTPFSQLAIWQGALKTLMHNLATRDPVEIESARLALKSAQTELKEEETTRLTAGGKTADVLLMDHISESVRRLCAYARDFGEILLNMLAHEAMITERDLD